MSFVDFLWAGVVTLGALLVLKLAVRGFLGDEDREDWGDFWTRFASQVFAIILMVLILTTRL